MQYGGVTKEVDLGFKVSPKGDVIADLSMREREEIRRLISTAARHLDGRTVERTVLRVWQVLGVLPDDSECKKLIGE